LYDYSFFSAPQLKRDPLGLMSGNRATAILSALKPLVSKPMWEAGWAGAIAWFQFGERVTRRKRGGGKREVGEYAVHVSSCWTWRTESGFIRADEDSTDLSQLGLLMARVESSNADESGRLTLRFDNGDVLEVEPDVSSNEADGIEYWRLFQPGLETPHVVSSNVGIEWHEA
jgi:hypothetical protein